MSTYEIQVKDVGTVSVTKKHGMKSVRLKISPRGEYKVSAPWFVPRSSIEKFVNERREWMIHHGTGMQTSYYDGMALQIGLILSIKNGAPRNSSKIVDKYLIVSFSSTKFENRPEQIAYIEKKIVKIMLEKAELELLPRLEYLAKLTGHSFEQAFAKRLTSRWGSCDSKQNITLNVYLVQLPEELIDYVILHELAHTKYMNHSAEFWSHLAIYCTDYKKLRSRLKSADPKIYEHNTLMA